MYESTNFFVVELDELDSPCKTPVRMAPSVDPRNLGSDYPGPHSARPRPPYSPHLSVGPIASRTNRLGALGGELLVAVRFFVDLDQGGAATSAPGSRFRQ